MEYAMKTCNICGSKVDNLFAAIAIMLMLTVIPHMIFLGWRIRREQKQLEY
jgi:alpha-glucoside transport system permease protein